jgi:probable selenium-dependent hydroxylase accessory protein YqeC
MPMNLLDVLHARRGVVCFVGAGGKKTTMYRLAALHPGRVLITTTAHIEYFPRGITALTTEPADITWCAKLAPHRGQRVLALAHACELRGRHAGLSPAELREVLACGGFDLCVVKSDGARSRHIKAPADHEPALPDFADTVVPIVSAKVFGRPLGEKIAHRPERITAVTGAQPGEPLTATHVARLLASAEGSLRRTGGATVVPVINMVDNRILEAAARAAAEEALALTQRFDRVVLAAMRSDEPIVRVVERTGGP